MKPIYKSQLIPFLCASLLCYLLIGSSIQPLMAASHTEQQPADGLVELQTLYMQFQFGIERAEAEQIVTRLGGVLIDWLEPLGIAKVQMPSSTAEVSASSVMSLAEQDPSIQFVETGAVVTGNELRHDELTDYNDPALGIPDESYGLTNIQALEAWGIVTGTQEVIIAILDTGINFEHPEFEGRIIEGKDFINNDDDPTDDHGHGSHVSGIAAAALNNAHGSAGVCPNCSILAIKVLNENNAGTWWSAAQGIIYAVDNGARVINLSLGANVPSDTIESAIEYAHEQGVLIVAAAGNSANNNNFYPAAYEGILGVSATTSSDDLWGLSNRGSYIDVAAPGHLIFGPDKTLDNNYGGYVYKSGTSMAAPHVAGLAGLLFSQNQERTADDVFNIITRSATDLGDESWDAYFGYGRINALAAVMFDEQLAPGTSENPPPRANEGGIAQQTGKILFMPISRRN